MAADFMPQVRAEAWKVYQRAPHALELEELVSLGLLGMTQAVNAWPRYCLDPGTPVLTADLRWIPARHVQVGLELVGFDEHPVAQGRRWLRSVVESVETLRLPRVRVELDDGRTVTCSTDHMWLTARQVGAYRAQREGIAQTRSTWQRAEDLRVGEQIISPLRVWREASTVGEGWLAGVFDGEGSIGHNNVSFAQNPGVVLDRAKALLSDFGIPFTMQPHSGSSCERVGVSVRPYVMETLGWLRPVRLMPKAAMVWEGKRMYGRQSTRMPMAVVTGVQLVGEGEVLAIGTSTRTFIANGLASHNCHKNGYDPNATHYLIAYILRRVRGAMLDALRSQDWVTRSARTRAKALRDAGQDQGLSDTELAARAGMTVREVRETVAAVAARPVSLDAEPHDMPAAEGTESRVVVSSILEAAVSELRTLPPTAQAVTVLRYYHGYSNAEAAAVLGVEEADAARWHTEAVTAMHAAMVRAVE